LVVGLTVGAGVVAGVMVWWTSLRFGETARVVVTLLLALGLPATVGALLAALWRRAVYVEVTGSALRWSGLLRRGTIPLADLRQVRTGWTMRSEGGQRSRFAAFRAGRASVTVHEAPAIVAEGSLGTVVAAVLAHAPHVRFSDGTRT
jgi:hypothetical protein